LESPTVEDEEALLTLEGEAEPDDGELLTDEHEPDESDLERESPLRATRRVSSGLAPTADIPGGKRKKAPPAPCYAPCEGCGAPVLTGTLSDGTQVILEPGIATYTALWLPDTPRPVLARSRGYPVHRCQGQMECCGKGPQGRCNLGASRGTEDLE